MKKTIIIASLIFLSLACTRPRPPTPMPPPSATTTALPPPITTTSTRLPTEPPPPTKTPTPLPSPTQANGLPTHTPTPTTTPGSEATITPTPTGIIYPQPGRVIHNNTRYRTDPGVQHPAYGHLHQDHQVKVLIEVLNEIDEMWCQIVNERWPSREDTFVFCELLGDSLDR